MVEMNADRPFVMGPKDAAGLAADRSTNAPSTQSATAGDPRIAAKKVKRKT
jgi:hypothetical protein